MERGGNNRMTAAVLKPIEKKMQRESGKKGENYREGKERKIIFARACVAS